MKGALFIVLSVWFGSQWLAAQDTVFIGKDYRWVNDPAKAVEYGVLTPEGKLTRVDFYTPGGRLKGYGTYSAYTEDPKKRKRQGKTVFLYSDGKDSLVSYYDKNRLNGESVVYYPNGQINLRINFRNGIIDGPLEQYYENGTVKRREKYVNMICDSGTLYGPDGAETVFVPYFRLPVFPGGVEGFTEVAGKFLTYPKEARKAGVRGQVKVTFTVEKDGKITNPRITKRVHPELDAEALRVVKKLSGMYTCEPGKVEDKPVRMSVTMPVTFLL